MFGIISLRVWLAFLKWIGKNMKIELKSTQMAEHLVLSNLAKNGVLEYFKFPHTYEDFIQEFQLEDNSYVQNLIEVLCTHQILFRTKEHLKHYYLNQKKPDKVLRYFLKYKPEEVPDEFPSHIMQESIEGDLSEVLKTYSTGIFSRLRGNSFGFTEKTQLFNWDSTLTQSLYKLARDSALRMARADKLKNGRVLDVGCGNGFGTADIWWSLQRNKNEIIGIDPSQDLLNIAQHDFALWVEQQNHDINLAIMPIPQFKQMSAEYLEFPDNSFDLVHCCHILHWVSHPELVIKEMARVIKPGGKICGAQTALLRPTAWIDIIIKTVEGTSGFVPVNKIREWFTQANLYLTRRTLFGFFCAIKPNSK